MIKNTIYLLIFTLLSPIINHAQDKPGKYYKGENYSYLKISESGEYKVSENYKMKVVWDDELTYDSSIDGYFGGIKTLTFYQNGKALNSVTDIKDGIGLGEIGFSFKDFNEDGYLDFRVPRASGKSIWYNYYIFNPEKQIWEIQNNYTTYSVYRWKDKEKRIFSTRPDGSAMYGSYYFVKIFEGSRIPLAKFYYQEDTKFNLIVDHESFKDTDYGGGVDTKNGHMLLLNAGKNSYTLEMEGDVWIYFQLPMIKVNDVPFILRRSLIPPNKSIEESFAYFKNKELEVLSNLTDTDMELECYENTIVEQDGSYFMFWEYTVPKGLTQNSELWKEHTAYESYNLSEKKMYLLDVIHENNFFRFAYNTSSTDRQEAEDFLMNLADGLRYYNKNIDSVKLAESIYEGKAYYEE